LQLAIIKEVCEQSWADVPTVREPLLARGVPYDDYMTYCQADLLAIAWSESRFNCSAIGDNGHSLGCFQIYKVVHSHLTDNDRYDFRFSASWTINRLVAYGWTPRTINGQANRHAIQCHNGCNVNNGYWQNAVKKSNEFIELYDNSR
jgi:hypothetical protein